jgi:hypothetical protein
MESGVVAKLAALRAAVDGVRDLPWATLSEADLLEVCSGIQDAHNVLPTAEHAAITALADQTTPAKIGAESWPEALRIRLRISQTEARRRPGRGVADPSPQRGVGDVLPTLPRLGRCCPAGEI